MTQETLQLPTAGPDRLDGWKSIASYLGRSVRTAHRWERELRMPVHRMSTGRGEVAFGVPSELDAWRRQLELTATGREALTDGPTTADDSLRAREDGVAAAASPSVPAEPAQRVGSPRAGYSRRWLFGAAGLMLVIAACVAMLRPHVQTASVSVADGTLSTFDASGHRLWSHVFASPLDTKAYEDFKVVGYETSRVVDIDGDGRNEVILLSNPGRTSSEGLYVFDDDGSVLFTHAPRRTVHYDQEYSAPWPPERFFVSRGPRNATSIWLVSHHYQEFPCVLEKLDPRGHLLGEYWSDGYISALAFTSFAGKSAVLVGSVNNEWRGASLAVLDEAAPTGAAPAVNPKYSCRDCPPGRPLKYIVFPRTALPEALGRLAKVSQINVERTGHFRVEVYQDAGPVFAEAGGSGPNTYYGFDADLRIVTAEYGSTYEAAHNLLRARGLNVPPFDGAITHLFPVMDWQPPTFVPIAGIESLR
jgi:hypothetical protein